MSDLISRPDPYDCASSRAFSATLCAAIRARVDEIGTRPANRILREKLRSMAGRDLRVITNGANGNIGPKRLLAARKARKARKALLALAKIETDVVPPHLRQAVRNLMREIAEGETDDN